jgi:hypothetical protein
MEVKRSMNIGGKKRRGRPIYVTSGDKAISLVPEITSRQWRVGGRSRNVTMHILKPFAVYVINAEGVHRLNFRDKQAWFRAFMLAIALLAPLPLQLLTRKDRPNDG